MRLLKGLGKTGQTILSEVDWDDWMARSMLWRRDLDHNFPFRMPSHQDLICLET
jgi:hypothetical protein